MQKLRLSMFKSFALFTICFLLTASILAPSVIVLMDKDAYTVMVMDLSDEENKKKESKKELDEKKFFFYTISKWSGGLVRSKISNKTYCWMYYNNPSKEIILPPPKQLS